MKEMFNLVNDASLTLPAMELALLLIIVSICLVLKFSRTGLITGYIFAYKWGWTFCLASAPGHMLIYMIFGAVVCILSVVNMLRT